MMSPCGAAPGSLDPRISGPADFGTHGYSSVSLTLFWFSFPIPSTSTLHLLARPRCSSTLLSSPRWRLLCFLYFLLLPEPRQYLLPPAQISIFKGDLWRYCAYPDRWNCWLSVSKADSLKSLQLLAESAGFAIFPREPFSHILPWIRLTEPLSFQATHTWMPSVPSVCPSQLSSVYLEAFSPSQIHFAYQQLVNLPEALLFSP